MRKRLIVAIAGRVPLVPSARSCSRVGATRLRDRRAALSSTRTQQRAPSRSTTRRSPTARAMEGDSRACYEQAFGNLAYRTSAKQALGETVTRGAKVTEISADCHRIAHTIGAAVLAREEGDVSVALAEGDSTCWSGFYHGLLERALAPARSTGELGRLIRDLCDPAGKDWPAFTHYQCLHGIGHGLMLRTGYQRDVFPRPLHATSRTRGHSQSCDGGVFMEGFSPSLGDKPPPWDPKPARAMPLGRRVAQALLLPPGRRQPRAGNELRLGEGRRRPARPRRTSTGAQYCFQSFGRQASGNNYGRPAAVAGLCALAGVLGEPDCVYGAVRDIASQAASGDRRRRSAGRCRASCRHAATRAWARSSPPSRRRKPRSESAAPSSHARIATTACAAPGLRRRASSRASSAGSASMTSPAIASRISCCGPVTVSRTSRTPRPSICAPRAPWRGRRRAGSRRRESRSPRCRARTWQERRRSHGAKALCARRQPNRGARRSRIGSRRWSPACSHGTKRPRATSPGARRATPTRSSSAR